MIYLTLSKAGKRPGNEDCLSPGGNAGKAPNLFIVCDGVGGAAKGEIASQLACSEIAGYFNDHLQGKRAGEKDIRIAIERASFALYNYSKSHPESRGLSTTLALVYLYDNNAIVAHIGDSRVYHVRNGEILFITRDHSFVNDLVSAGIITNGEAAHHPKRNVINKAISGTKEPVDAEISSLSGLCQGDYFLLCTDGILEGINEAFIKDNFLSSAADTQEQASNIMQKIDKACSENSRDNYSAIIIHLIDEPLR